MQQEKARRGRGLAVGFVGLGDLGLPMAQAIAEAGFALHAWGLPPDPLSGLSGTPHIAHDDVGSLAAASDIVGLCVSTDEDVREVTAAMIGRLRPGTVIVNHGTGSPRAAIDLAEFCAAHQVEVLDAPVAGARRGAQARALTTFVGGKTAALELCEPVFRAFSAQVIHLGGHGAGQLAKLVNNTLLMMNRANVADLVELLSAGGVNPVPVVNAVKSGTGTSMALQMLPTGAEVSADAALSHLTGIELLDAQLFAESMRDLGVDASLVTARAASGAHRLSEVFAALNPPRPIPTPS